MFYTVCLVAGSFCLIGVSFVWFLGRSTEDMEEAGLLDKQECGDNLVLIIVTIIMQVLVFAFRCRPDTSIFTGALVNLWLSYLLWSALASQPAPYCNTLYGSSAATLF